MKDDIISKLGQTFTCYCFLYFYKFSVLYSVTFAKNGHLFTYYYWFRKSQFCSECYYMKNVSMIYEYSIINGGSYHPRLFNVSCDFCLVPIVIFIASQTNTVFQPAHVHLSTWLQQFYFVGLFFTLSSPKPTM